jgi:HK97 family phage portal protein
MRIFKTVRPSPFASVAEASRARPIVGTKERSFIEHRLKVPINRLRDYKGYLETGCKNVWATFRAVHLCAATLLGTEFRVQSARTQEEVGDPNLDRLLSNPNPWDSWEEMLYQWVFHMKLTGSAYWVKDEVNGRGQPLSLYPLLPQHVILEPDPVVGVSRYIYRVNGQEVSFLPNEIIHFRRPHPMDPIQGLGDIEPSTSLYNDHINRNTYQEKFLEEGAMPSGILTYKGTEQMPASLQDMDEGEWGKLKKWWQVEYAGKANSGKTAFLTGEWDYLRLGLTHSEMESLEQEQFTIRQIFMNHGVPLSLAGMGDDSNYATARQQEINFRRYEIVPLLNILVGKLSQEGALTRLFGKDYKMVYELSGLIDVEQVHKDYLPLVAAGGMTLNELRGKMGIEEAEAEGLDQFFIPNNLVPIEMAGAGPVDELGLALLQNGVNNQPAFTPEPEGEPTESPAPVAEGDNAQVKETLNGAQIQSLVTLAQAVAEGTLPKDTAVQIIIAAFPFDEERAERILAGIEEGETGQTQAAAPPVPPS